MGEHPASTPVRQGPPRLLVIRRDNIGDLVCTTPLIAALRERYPDGHIAALVNTYNEAVLAGNPDVDAVYAYEKGKHRRGRSILAVYADRMRLIAKLRSQKFDYAILATPGFAAHSLRLARWVGARHVLGYSDPGKTHARLDIALPYDGGAKTHEVERVFGLLKALGIKSSPPAARVFPDPSLVVDPRQAHGSGTPVVGACERAGETSVARGTFRGPDPRDLRVMARGFCPGRPATLPIPRIRATTTGRKRWWSVVAARSAAPADPGAVQAGSWPRVRLRGVWTAA
jgi:hypothetical protein